MFEPKDKSTLPYWFAHWCAFNLTALKLGVWKIKYLFHDLEKPFLLAFLGDYEKVRQFHRKHNRHHWTYKDKTKIDWEGMVIDWECSRLTKKDSPLTAKQLYEYTITTRYREGRISSEMCMLLMTNIPPILTKFKLTK